MNQRPEAGEHDPYYARYVEKVPAGDLLEILARQFEATAALLRAAPAERADYRYAPDKWSLKEVVGHIADTERIMAYRALRFARGDRTPLAGFEQDDYVPVTGCGSRSLDDLVDELGAVRRATLALLTGLPAEAWTRRGEASGAEVSVRALACIIAGHELHHRALIESRYLDGATASAS